MANTLKTHLIRYLRELRSLQVPDLLEGRYQKFRKMGVYQTAPPEEPSASEAPGGEAASPPGAVNGTVHDRVIS